MFWGNFFTISDKDFLAHYSTGAYQREIIRPNLNQTFEHKFGKPTEWKKKCLTLEENKSAKDFKKFLIKNFKFKKIQEKSGLLTGYYEPIIRVSRNRDTFYKFPILKKSNFYTKKPRSFIEKNFRGEDVILWTDDEINLFFLHVQGSGIGEFPNKKKIKLVCCLNKNLRDR